MQKPPYMIYLQVDPGGEKAEGVDMIGPNDITWCQDKINDTDVKYIRADSIKDAPHADDCETHNAEAGPHNYPDGGLAMGGRVPYECNCWKQDLT